MSPRPIEAVAAEAAALWPPGWIWPEAGSDDLIRVLDGALARGIADAEATLAKLLEEIDPRRAGILLEDYERVLGPDPCGRDIAILPAEERRAIAYMRWIGQGSQSVPYYIAVAAARGVTITIEEFQLFRVGSRASDILVNHPGQFVWRITLSTSRAWRFRVGMRASDRLWSYLLSDIECDLGRIKPAHTEIEWTYLAAAEGDS